MIAGGNTLAGPVVRTWHFHCQGPGSIPGQGTKIPQTTWYSPLSSQKIGLMMEVAQHQIYWSSGKKGPSIVWWLVISSAVYHLQFSSVAQSCLTHCDPMDCRMPGLPGHLQLPEFTQTHVHWVSDAIQLSYPLLSPFPPAFNHNQHQSLFKWVNSWHQVAKVLEFWLQHQSFQWIFRTDFL